MYKLEKKNNEKFDSVSDTKALINQVYNADIEAIRNLSSIASKLIKEGGLVVPGQLQVNGKLNLPNNTSLSADGDNATQWLRLQQTNNPAQYKSLAVKDLWCNTGDSILYSTTINNTGNATINGNAQVGNDLILAGQNQWIIHTPDDQRRIMHIAPYTNNTWDWGNGISIDNTGTLTAGTLTAGTLKANGNITIGNTTINESHLQMLTGQIDFLIEHTRRRKGNNNTDPNQGPSRYLHSGDNGVISRYKDENASFFKLAKQ